MIKAFILLVCFNLGCAKVDELLPSLTEPTYRKSACGIYPVDPQANIKMELDTAFGDNGVQTIESDWVNYHSIRDYKGRLIISGKLTSQSQSTIFVRRLKINDSNLEEELQIQINPNNQYNYPLLDVDLQDNIYLLVSDSVSKTNSLYKYLESGMLDLTYGIDGKVELNNSINTLEVSEFYVFADGSLIVLGKDSTSWVAVKLTSEGTIDRSFSSMGEFRAPTPGRQFYKIEALPDGKIYLVGIDNNNYFKIFRLNRDSSLDETFNNTGTQKIDIGDNFVSILRICSDSYGKAFVATSRRHVDITQSSLIYPQSYTVPADGSNFRTIISGDVNPNGYVTNFAIHSPLSLLLHGYGMLQKLSFDETWQTHGISFNLGSNFNGINKIITTNDGRVLLLNNNQFAMIQ